MSARAQSRQRDDERLLQLDCIIAQHLAGVSPKLDDILTLVQQQTDLLRRLVERVNTEGMR